jgi:isopentenyl diphosphate isomerase/L-lactate dehydrogenase-like FMN-dependent dehydrogenase
MSDLVTVEDFRERARELLPKSVYDYYAGGAGDEWTLRENRSAFERFALIPRVLVDVSTVDLSTSALGQEVSLPVLGAPTALHRMAHPDGEVATARACRDAGTVMTVSTLASSTIEDVASVGGPRWFQLYVMEDRGRTEELIRRAHTAGFSAIVLTVDLPVLGIRDRDERNSFELPEGVSFANLPRPEATDAEGSELFDFVLHRHDRSLDWDDLAWIRSLAPLPLVLKGVIAAEDARLAADAGADAIIVSNHGGRQLDGTLPSVEALPDVVEAVDGRLEVYVDGGVRRGVDVLKAVALGARAVLVGRPLLWGLAVDGEAGVRRILDILRLELEIAMAIAGVRSMKEITPDLVRRR